MWIAKISCKQTDQVPMNPIVWSPSSPALAVSLTEHFIPFCCKALQWLISCIEPCLISFSVLISGHDSSNHQLIQLIFLHSHRRHWSGMELLYHFEKNWYIFIRKFKKNFPYCSIVFWTLTASTFNSQRPLISQLTRCFSLTPFFYLYTHQSNPPN